MSSIGLALLLVFALCGIVVILALVLPERRSPSLVAWGGSLAALSALWASGAVLADVSGFHAELWTIGSAGTMTVSLDHLSALFLFAAAVVVLASSPISNRSHVNFLKVQVVGGASAKSRA